MSIQTVDGRDVYVIDFATMPELPITAGSLEDAPYAAALDDAIRTGVITEPGKYGIEIKGATDRIDYSIYAIKE
jgi:hypothetical protein